MSIEITDDQVRELAERYKVTEDEVRAFYGKAARPRTEPAQPTADRRDQT